MNQLEAPEAETRVVYPFSAIAVVAAAWMAVFFMNLFGAASLMLCVVTAPILVGMLVGAAGLLSSALEYARAKARVVPRRAGRGFSAWRRALGAWRTVGEGA